MAHGNVVISSVPGPSLHQSLTVWQYFTLNFVSNQLDCGFESSLNCGCPCLRCSCPVPRRSRDSDCWLLAGASVLPADALLINHGWGTPHGRKNHSASGAVNDCRTYLLFNAPECEPLTSRPNFLPPMACGGVIERSFRERRRKYTDAGYQGMMSLKTWRLRGAAAFSTMIQTTDQFMPKVTGTSYAEE